MTKEAAILAAWDRVRELASVAQRATDALHTATAEAHELSHGKHGREAIGRIEDQVSGHHLVIGAIDRARSCANAAAQGWFCSCC